MSDLALSLAPLIERSVTWSKAQQGALGEAMQLLVAAQQAELAAIHALNDAINPANTWRWYEIQHSDLLYRKRTAACTRVCGYSEEDAIARLRRRAGTDAKHIFEIREVEG